jgi:hypothetical protein
MTFEDFQQLCNQAVSTSQEVVAPCPIVVGDGEIHAALGDTPDHHIVIFKTSTDNAALRSIYSKVRFRFDAPNNQTVISPITTGT